MNLRNVLTPQPKSTLSHMAPVLAMMIVMGSILMAIGMGASCSGPQKATDKALAACVLTSIEPQVNSALTTAPEDPVSWLAVLTGIAAQCGPDLVTLAVQAFQATPVTVPITSATTQTAAQRAAQWLMAHPGSSK